MVEVMEQLRTKLDANTLVFFANGSLIPGKGGGAAAILTNTQTMKTTYVGKDSIIIHFETELMALYLCQKLLFKNIINYGPPQPISPQERHSTKVEDSWPTLDNKSLQQHPELGPVLPS
ncbi:hypothetical protein O181_090688 [Austropuccinia psidii MF-1]|uniref:Uncharacterized protein n=1 Tax=Austropuccinia psidii MF-1 TaxID=1389203 RepID=A0A9Q3IVH2_9BASI|nr:hypothetical protein [Austropuccinia psidii MF-1]